MNVTTTNPRRPLRQQPNTDFDNNPDILNHKYIKQTKAEPSHIRKTVFSVFFGVKMVIYSALNSRYSELFIIIIIIINMCKVYYPTTDFEWINYWENCWLKMI